MFNYDGAMPKGKPVAFVKFPSTTPKSLGEAAAETPVMTSKKSSKIQDKRMCLRHPHRSEREGGGNEDGDLA